MAKSTIIFLYLLLLPFLCYSSDANSLRKCAVTCAQDEIGIQELTGNNDGVRVEQYLRHVGLPKGYPWCAAAMSFILDLCGVDNPRSPYCPDWFKEKYLVYKRNSEKDDFDVSKPGDMIGIWFSSKSRIAHIGMIESTEGATVTTLEGNTTDFDYSRDGQGFYRKYRLKNQIYAVSSFYK